jgi:hypothetical protein
MARMKELQHDEGAFSVNNEVAAALEKLTVALAAARMSAHVTMKRSSGETVEFSLGMDRTSGNPHALKARESSGEGSHLGWLGWEDQ